METQNAQQHSGASDDNISVAGPSTPQHDETVDSCVNCEMQILHNENRHHLSSESEHLIRVIQFWTYPRNVSIFIWQHKYNTVTLNNCPLKISYVM